MIAMGLAGSPKQESDLWRNPDSRTHSYHRDHKGRRDRRSEDFVAEKFSDRSLRAPRPPR